jgi:hypothetical protein
MEGTMKQASVFCHPPLRRRTQMLLTAILMTLETGEVQKAIASPRTQIQRPVAEWSVREQVPGQFALHVQHDKPLLVEGSVRDSQGRPLKGAHVAVIVQFPRPTSPRNHWAQPLQTTIADDDGGFVMATPSLPLYQIERLYAIARCDGFGVGAAELDVASLRHKVEIRLEKEKLLHARLVGPDGTPAVGVEVRTCLFYERWPGRLVPETFFACSPDWQPFAWVRPATTDEQGRLTLSGVPRSKARSLVFQFSIDDPRYAPLDPDLLIPSEREQEQAFAFRPDDSEEPIIRLEEPRFVEGTVVCYDTGEPMAGAWLSVVFCNKEVPADNQFAGIWVQTDVEGRFRARGRPRACCTIYVYPPIGCPYPAWGQSIKWPEGQTRYDVAVEVPKGILMRGKVVEAGSGKPVAGAGVEYQLRRAQPDSYYNKEFAFQIYWAAEYRRVLTEEDGTFQMAVVPGLGHLLVKAPSPDFVSRYVTWGDLQYGKPGAFWYVVEGLARIDPQPGMDQIELTIPLHRGLTVRGSVLDPQGKPVPRAALLTPAYPRLTFTHSVPTTGWSRPAIDGRFELPGCDPNQPRRVYILNAARQWGAAVDVDPVTARREPPVVRLLPCGWASARFVDQQGKPWADARVPVSVYLVFKKGRPQTMPSYAEHLDWWATPTDRHRYANLWTDSQGYVTFPTLIPHAPYMLRLHDEVLTATNQKEKELEFTVEPGQTRDLGQITLERRDRPDLEIDE